VVRIPLTVPDGQFSADPGSLALGSAIEVFSSAVVMTRVLL
jgi:hypothetical protein